MVFGLALMGFVKSDPFQIREYTKGTVGFLASSGAYRQTGVWLLAVGAIALLSLRITRRNS